jgi:hypothetical protein
MSLRSIHNVKHPIKMVSHTEIVKYCGVARDS